MYTLTLTHTERQQIADADPNLRISSRIAPYHEPCLYWSDWETVTFYLPEIAVHEIRDIAERDNFMWPGLSNDLAEKLQDVIDSL